jgi:aminopeptidase YwaD
MKSFFIILLSFFLYIVTYLGSQELNLPNAEIRNNTYFLSTDEMKGRYPGTPENQKAADFIDSKFNEIGLSKFNDNYKIPFKFIDTLRLTDKNDVNFSVLIRKPGVPENMLRSRKKHWETAKEWIPMRFSPNGTVEGEIVFCGYGITSQETGYDDYKDIDVTGKIVVVLADSSEGMPLDDFWTPYSDLSYKVDNAAKHGAAGIIFVKVLHDSANVFYDFDVDRNYKSEIIAIHANRTEIADFFPKRFPLLKMERKINETKKPNSFILPDVKVSISVEIENVEKDIDNIIAYVEGTDQELKKEYIIVGANFDGFGAYWETPKWRPKIWTVLNSADNNASGVAALLELAKKIKNSPLKRSVIFTAFNAGTVRQDGAKAFVASPPVPIENIIFMLNLNSVGRINDNKLYAIGTSTAANLSHIINSAKNIDSSLNIIQGQKSYYRSDHIPFYNEAIPVIMLTTGMHTDLQKPTDDAVNINFSGIARIVDYSAEMLTQIANSPMKPVFNPDPLIRDYRTVKKGYRCWLGIVPDYEINPNGIAIADIYRSSPAEKSGLKKGDVIKQFDGKKIENFHDLRVAESLTKPGDIIVLNILRDGQEKAIKVKMAKQNK